MKLYKTCTCPQQDSEPIYHIPDEPGSDTTLCGLSDVPHEMHCADEHPPDCVDCLAIVAWCRKIRFKRA